MLRRVAAPRRWFCVASAPTRRVLCSLDELKNGKGSALKFPLSASAEASAEPSSRGAKSQATRGGRTGFVFFCEASQAPRAFINSCPHALLELDLDDSDFFCDGFVQCKAHGAFFDPQTGICLQGPAAARQGRLEKQLGALTELAVRVEDAQVVLADASVTPLAQAKSEHEWRDYRARRQHDLAAVLASRQDDMERLQHALDAKTMARLRQYATPASVARRKRADDETA